MFFDENLFKFHSDFLYACFVDIQIRWEEWLVVARLRRGVSLVARLRRRVAGRSRYQSREESPGGILRKKTSTSQSKNLDESEKNLDESE